MTQKTISFAVTPSKGIDTYWIAVGNEDVRLINGKGSIKLISNKHHILIWYMSGSQDDKLTIVGKNSQSADVVKVESKIPKKMGDGGGTKRFLVE